MRGCLRGGCGPLAPEGAAGLAELVGIEGHDEADPVFLHQTGNVGVEVKRLVGLFEPFVVVVIPDHAQLGNVGDSNAAFEC